MALRKILAMGVLSKNTNELKTGAPGRFDRHRLPVDLIFGSNSELRAVAEFYAADERAGGLRARLHRGMDQGDDAGPLRPALIGGVELLERRGSRHGSRCRAALLHRSG